MDLVTYKQKKDDFMDQIKAIHEQLAQLKEEFIEANKPCEVDEFVELIRENNVRTTGQVKEFGISAKDEIYVKTIIVTKQSARKGTSVGRVYLSKPPLSFRKITLDV